MAQKQETPYNNNLFSNHFLEERLQNLEEWRQAEIEEEYEKIQSLWEEKKRYLQNSPNEDNTQGEWIDEILKIIGHTQWGSEPTRTIGNGRNLNPDYLFFKDFETRLDSENSDNEFEEGYMIGEAKKYGRTLDKSMDNHENPSFQIFNYVDRLRTPWGLLTNGKKWRLYSYEDCEADTFYEIDIVESILKESDEEQALKNFKYFYLFFRQESFLPSQNSFVDRVYEGSESYSQDLEDDLEDDIYTALEETARGFFETNDLEKTEENIEEVHRSSLILLYRMLFVLNAESRGLLPIDNQRYENYSLEFLKKQFLEEEENVFTNDTWLWEDRISTLFDVIDEGRDYENFKVTGYNGGLFDDEKHPFLANHNLKGPHIKRIIELLAISEDPETGEVALVDYRDLNIRHLGSVYEGLLEHELRQAKEDLVLKNGEWESAIDSNVDLEELPREKKVREGEVYLTNESGERKATGSYYTPEYIVEYIVENTVGPKVKKKIEESDEEELLNNVLDLNICDPAMGSGHFLTEATSFMARRILEHGKIAEEDIEGDNEFVWVKRQIVSHCIYGVDINPLAVELGKLSLWIETMAEGKPLSFLDHHLKTGNSLVGSNFDEIFSHPTEKQKKIDSDRWQFVGSPEDLKVQFQEEYQEIEDMDESTKEKVHEKEQEYQDFKESTLYSQIQQLANLHTRQYFEEEANSSDYEDFIVNIGMEDTAMESMEWFKSAQKDAEIKNYFHWEIEFPKVFFGQKKGFDAVVGNPPYARIQSLKEHFPETAEYYEGTYNSSTQNFDIYCNFTEKGWNILDRTGLLGYIEPHKFFQARMGEGLRTLISENKTLYQITNFGEHQVFSEASVYTCILILSKEPQEKIRYNEINPKEIQKGGEIEHYEIEADYGSDKWVFNNPKTKSVLEKIDNKGRTLDELTRKIFVGLQTSADKIYLLEKIEEPSNGTVIVKDQFNGEEWELETGMIKPILKGDDVHRYQPVEPKYWVIFPYELSDDGADFIKPETIRTEYPKTWDYLKAHEEDLRGREGGNMDHEKWYEFGRLNNLDEFENSKIMTPEMSNGSNFTYDSEGVYHNTMVYSFILSEETEISDKYLLSVLNNNLLWFFLSNTGGGNVMRGGYFRFKTDYLNPFSVPEIEFNLEEEERNEAVKKLKNKFVENQEITPSSIPEGVKHNFLVYLSDRMMELNDELDSINLNIEDYLGNYREGDTLDELYIPASGVSDTPLTDTASDREKLQVGSVDTQRNGDSVTVLASARYKPEDESSHDTDRYGYTETEMFSAMEFHDLSETEKALIEEFVPVAVDEAGGFADFRKKATQTMSLIDRLKKLTLPKVSDVEDDLQNFIEHRNKAEELEEKIEKTDQEINEIVYDLYDLTEEEIEIVEESVE